MADPSHVLEPEPLGLEENLTYVERPVRIMDHKIRVTRGKEVKLVRVQWNRHGQEESTWELEITIRAQHPHLFD